MDLDDHGDELSRMRSLFLAALIVFAQVAFVNPRLAAILLIATLLVWIGADAWARRPPSSS